MFYSTDLVTVAMTTYVIEYYSSLTVYVQRYLKLKFIQVGKYAQLKLMVYE